MCVDSDDMLASNALENIEKDFKQIKAKNIAGIMYNQGYISDKSLIIGY